MNRKTTVWLIILAVCSAAVCLIAPGNGGSILFVAAVPFTLLGKGLRALSLSGSAGNMTAIVIYTIICLLPLGLLLKKKRRKEDWMLVLESTMLFYVMYLMINPGLMPKGMNSEVSNVILSGTIYSIFLTWGVLKLLRRGENMDMNGGYRALQVLLWACAALYIVAGFGVGAGDLKEKIVMLRERNTMPGQNLLDTSIFLFLIFAVQALEYALDACLMIHGITLAKELEQNPYTESCVAAAGVLSKKAKAYLIAILLSNMALNVGQLLSASRLYHIDASVRIPVFSVALCFGCMVLTRLLGEGKELKEENDLYI